MKRLFSLICVLASVSANAAIECAHLKSDDPDYAQTMGDVMRAAGVKDGYYNRFDEDVVYFHCNGRSYEIPDLVGKDMPLPRLNGILAALGADPVRERKGDQVKITTNHVIDVNRYFAYRQSSHTGEVALVSRQKCPLPDWSKTGWSRGLLINGRFENPACWKRLPDVAGVARMCTFNNYGESSGCFMVQTDDMVSTSSLPRSAGF